MFPGLQGGRYSIPSRENTAVPAVCSWLTLDRFCSSVPLYRQFSPHSLPSSLNLNGASLKIQVNSQWALHYSTAYLSTLSTAMVIRHLLGILWLCHFIIIHTLSRSHDCFIHPSEPLQMGHKKLLINISGYTN